ncbi:HlyD family secretion protein [Wenzhouxiangella sediminis]|uniref:Biotin/lipoyl-binding protein n=1 Tax=Wenzhouxiangella sediminis TaxID=1792836 RepID=A0A3E1K6L8_9GAMM|nr:biotin/lipoyl-binding protein [Wenzhouxiangella sediminis]RFF29664.1 biotin/lipoyl-binding protein [Wenzhouxiangella sediminis]
MIFRNCAQAVLTLLVLAGCNGDPEYPVVGTLERDRIALAAEMAEPVVEIHVREGQQVAAGAVLVELDTRRAEADLDRVEAVADRARRRLDELLRGPRQEAIDEARARLAAAESGLATARHELQRVERLEQRNLASESQLDNSANARDQALGEYDAARAALAALVEGTTVEELDQARAAVREAEAAVRRQQLSLERLTVTAPRAARVEDLPFELGETPRVGESLALLRAVDQPPYARVYVPAELHGRFRAGETVRVLIDGHGHRTGRVRYVATDAAYTPYYALTEHDAGRLSYLAEIDLENAADLPSGVPVRAVAPTGPSGGDDE